LALKQQSFSSLEQTHKKKQTKREVFLGEKKVVVPWPRLEALIAPHHIKPRKGRPQMPLSVMLCITCREVDETTILNFRHLLEKHKLTEALFDAVKAYIPMQRGFLYLVALMDRYSRKVLSWRLYNGMEADFCVEALNEVIAKYGKPEIMNCPSHGLKANHCRAADP